MSDDISPDEYRSVVGRQLHQVDTEPNVLTYEQSLALGERDKFFTKYGIALGIGGDPSDGRIDEVYENRIKR